MKKGWQSQKQKTLKKVVFALTKAALDKNIGEHEKRGWQRASDVREHGYGLGVMMIFPPPERKVI